MIDRAAFVDFSEALHIVRALFPHAEPVSASGAARWAYRLEPGEEQTVTVAAPPRRGTLINLVLLHYGARNPGEIVNLTLR